jgi:hypothetical protein
MSLLCGGQLARGPECASYSRGHASHAHLAKIEQNEATSDVVESK